MDADVNEEQKSNDTISTSTSLTGGDITAEWHQIGATLTDLNEKINAIRLLREYTITENKKTHDGGFDKGDDVLFFSKVDNQYIAGVVKEKRKDKISKDYVYKITKTHKRDPEVDEELGAKKRSAKEDPRVEIIKFRQQRAKKPATIAWNNKASTESYFKIMSVNDYQIELQKSLLKILRSRVKDVLKKRKKIRKLSSRADKINTKMSKSKKKRDKRQRVAATFGGMRQEMINLSKRSSQNKAKLSPRNSGKRSSTRTKHSASVSQGYLGALTPISDYGSDGIATPVMDKVNKPEGDPTTWSEEDVLTWLQWISQNECEFEVDKEISDEERKNFKKARKTLLENYFEKFINAEIDGKALEKLDNNTLRNKVYMNNVMDRKIVVKALQNLFGERKHFVKASNYGGTEYDFSKDWKKSMRAEIEFQKRKLAAGDLSKARNIGRNDYQGTEWTQDMDASGDMFQDKISKHSKNASFLARKKAAGMKRHKTVAEIGTAEDYVIPDYADKAIADTMVGQAVDERQRWGQTGMDPEGDNKELLKILLHANIHIPAELTTPVKGYHTIQNRNAQLRNLLLKHQALLDDEDATNNPELARAKALQETRDKFDKAQSKKVMDALKTGDLESFKKTYGNKHKKIRQVQQILDQAEKDEERKIHRKRFRKRMKDNKSSLALLKKKRKEKADISSSMALTDLKDKSKSRHSRKRSNSMHDIKFDPKQPKQSKKKTKRPSSATHKSLAPIMDFEEPKEKKRSRKRKPKMKRAKTPNADTLRSDPKPRKKRVSFKVDEPLSKPKKRVSFALPDDEEHMSPPKAPKLLSNDSNVSDGTVILHSGKTPSFAGGLIDSDLSSPKFGSMAVHSSINSMDSEDILENDDNMHHVKSYSKSVVVHDDDSANVSPESGSMDEGSWDENGQQNETNNTDTVDINIGELMDSDSSEITFSDDDDDGDDNDDDDDDAVPLSIIRLRQQEQAKRMSGDSAPRLPKLMSGVVED